MCVLARRNRVRVGRPPRAAAAKGACALTTPLALRPHLPPLFSQTRAMSSKLVVVFMFLALMRAQTQTVITLAGGNSSGTTSGSTNGVGTAALLNLPIGVAVDTSGNVIVADYSNNKIRLIYPFSCSPGTYANFTSRSCILCPPGSFSSTSSAESCILCLSLIHISEPTRPY